MSLYSQEKARNLDAHQFLDDLTRDVAEGIGDGSLEEQFKEVYPDGYTEPGPGSGPEVKTPRQLITSYLTSAATIREVLNQAKARLH